MGRVCCVSGCPSGGDVPAHQIPKNPDLFKKWKNMIYSEKIEHLTDEQISKCTVCYRHFANDDYLVTYKVRKLKRGIVPSLNLPNKSIKKEIFTKADTASASASTDTIVPIAPKEESTEDEEETIVVGLFEDLPESLEPRLLKLPSSPMNMFEEAFEQVDQNIDHIDLISEVCESSYKPRIFRRRKRTKLTEKELMLLQCKKQAERYAKTPTIRKLLSLLAATKRSKLQSKIQRSKYVPRVYVRLYHDIAKKNALGQL
ncbi:uncharacterized protein LOC105191123 isoform X1 [Harpegnathos saltator]|uniref:uncharacterized protein LOC105191123 isoform X1 n=1 Tax=Harpegnathos saltator TaxID=610380 RepID=UPI00058DE1E5|nr:uncharacterized protein LOC105191123 isoform X1 [Harpegnathos saltator]